MSGRLTLIATARLVHDDPAVGQREAHALFAAGRSMDPIEAACPMQSVETFGLMYCIVS